MRRKIKALLAAVPPILICLLTYMILNLEEILEGASFVAAWLGTTQGQFSAVLVIAGTGLNLYGKFKQTNLPKSLGKLFGWKKALRNLTFLNELLDRFTFEEVMTLLRNVDVLQEDMKEAVHSIAVTLTPENTVKVVTPLPKKSRPRRTRNELAFAVAEQLKLLGKKVEVAVIAEKIKIPTAETLKEKVLGTFQKPIEQARAREQARIRRLHESLKFAQKHLASLLDIKETQPEPKDST